MKKNNQILKLVCAALLAAMTCVVTMILPIKISYGNGGYIHPGDGFVLLSGIILGPVYGGFAAAIGSMLADLLSGYAQYAPATFLIKFLAAAIGAISYRRIPYNSVIVSGIFGGVIVTIGYFLYDSFLSGTTAAALSGVPFNLLQCIMGIVIASIILPLLLRVPQIKNIMGK